MAIPGYPSFPLPPKTELSFSSDLTPYKINFVKGEKTIYKSRNYPTASRSADENRFFTNSKTTAEGSFFSTDLETIETFLYSRQGYPFEYNGSNYVCLKYTITYVSENKGNISMTLVKYTNPSIT